MKRWLSLLVGLVLMVSLFTATATAEKDPVEEPVIEFDVVKAKHNLMEKAKKEANTKKIVKKSFPLAIFNRIKLISSVDVAMLNADLEESGVYRLDTPNGSEFNTTSVDNGDITMKAPSIYYDSNTREWVVTGGGYWHGDAWLEHVPAIWCQFFGNAEETCDVGGYDGFGVGFVNTDGNYSASVNSSYSQISDGEGHAETTTVRSDGNGELGFGFQLQDYIYKKFDGVSPVTTNFFSYIGKHFAGLTRYTSSFVDYNGNAVSYYSHTWDDTSLQSVSFGLSGKTAGVEFNYVNEGYQFPGYSSDTSF